MVSMAIIYIDPGKLARKTFGGGPETVEDVE